MNLSTKNVDHEYAVQFGAKPKIKAGVPVWCKSKSGYDQRIMVAWVPTLQGWQAQVKGRTVTLPKDFVFLSREECHQSLVADLEELYKRQVHRCRRLRQNLDGMRHTVQENLAVFKVPA